MSVGISLGVILIVLLTILFYRKCHQRSPSRKESVQERPNVPGVQGVSTGSAQSQPESSQPTVQLEPDAGGEVAALAPTELDTNGRSARGSWQSRSILDI